ncbi:hypothetical protein [Rhizobacter sp. OV335]|uniref:hypothetical protein n=1 Tax=Rhizobacter sp. OV335 TaxID=1500264 RepID=UPI0009191375|nr:hypothetical protein [Rhizobacter sp. OV335]SHN13882.1 hypothetical protein SAMN02787076_03564 [Rhizobacter sp. OV335]
MAWQSLIQSLDTKAKVVAGPILRRVSPKAATVWLALRVGATVTITVVDQQGGVVMQGQRRSVAIGRHLHLVAVTARLVTSHPDAIPGVNYQYTLNFVFDDGETCDLAKATKNARLAYADQGLHNPSFALPPAKLSQLRIYQGSCRKASGAGNDMLPLLDTHLAVLAGNPLLRPHQLLLTGDQIYADDVASSMLTMLGDASDVLLGWKEVLPRAGGKTVKPSEVAPYRRGTYLTEAGFTSEDRETHLMSLGEYLCMYLFAWSPELWFPDAVPLWPQIYADALANTEGRTMLRLMPKLRHFQDGAVADIARIGKFRSGLEKVRCALANVPTYMIFDDHEITDDWNMDMVFCNGVYGNPLGRRMVQNGLLAYALCQHWGNKPEDFEGTAAGAKLLALVDTPNPAQPQSYVDKASKYDDASATLSSLLGVPQGRLDATRALSHGSNALTYDYFVEGPAHLVIFADTRTWRAFPRASDGTHLLPPAELLRQIGNAPSPGERLMMVVLTTNAPPVQPIRAASRHDRLTNILQDHPDLYEAWDLPSESFDRLLTTLTSKLPARDGLSHKGAVLLLSGDVHMSFASRLVYRATRRFGDAGSGQSTAAVIAQLVASSLKKQTDDTVGFHTEGYFHSPHAELTQLMIRHALTEGYVGWNPSSWPAGTVVGNDPLFGALRVERRTLDVSQAEAVDGQPVSALVTLAQPPDYRYRLDYLLPTGEAGTTRPVLPFVPPLPTAAATPAERAKVAKAYETALSSWMIASYAKAQIVVGLNNLGELTFAGETPAELKALHRLHWTQPNPALPRSTLYTVRLDVNAPNDPEFPDIRSRNGL